MTVAVGDPIPNATLRRMGADGMTAVETAAFFADRKVVLFSVPGAFTPTCSVKHLPGFVTKADDIKAKGVDEIVCIAVNDAFVMGAWAKDQGTGDKVMMLADGSAAFTKSIDLVLDLTERGMGVRSHRYAMVVEDGVVKSLDVESNPGGLEVSSAEAVLAKL